MIDGLWKARQDRFWDALARPLARTGVSPNAVTLAGLGLCAANAGAFVWHGNLLLFGCLIALTELLDDLDGAVARVSGSATAFGGYLDAVTDRYKDAAYLLAVAVVTGYWVICFVAAIGAVITSYNKARAAVEAPITNEAWPDLFERLERTALLCAGLILTGFVPVPGSRDLLYLTLFTLAVLTHATAIQRMLRAKQILQDAPTAPAQPAAALDSQARASTNAGAVNRNES